MPNSKWKRMGATNLNIHGAWSTLAFYWKTMFSSGLKMQRLWRIWKEFTKAFSGSGKWILDVENNNKELFYIFE